MSHPCPGELLFVAFAASLASVSGVAVVDMLPFWEVPHTVSCHPSPVNIMCHHTNLCLKNFTEFFFFCLPFVNTSPAVLSPTMLVLDMK